MSNISVEVVRRSLAHLPQSAVGNIMVHLYHCQGSACRNWIDPRYCVRAVEAVTMQSLVAAAGPGVCRRSCAGTFTSSLFYKEPSLRNMVSVGRGN